MAVLKFEAPSPSFVVRQLQVATQVDQNPQRQRLCCTRFWDGLLSVGPPGGGLGWVWDPPPPPRGHFEREDVEKVRTAFCFAGALPLHVFIL